jgi:hypothetical protein
MKPTVLKHPVAVMGLGFGQLKDPAVAVTFGFVELEEPKADTEHMTVKPAQMGLE